MPKSKKIHKKNKKPLLITSFIVVPAVAIVINIVLFCTLFKNNNMYMPHNTISAPIETKVSVKVKSNAKLSNDNFLYDYDER
jgi:hypothetical protein